MEIAGLALSGLGVVGIFTVCVQAFDMVQIVRTQDRSLHILATKLDNQKARFWIWGQARGLDDPEEYDQRLNHPVLRDRIQQNCTLLYQILSESNQLKSRYGLKEESSPDDRFMLTSGEDEGSVWQATFRRIRAKVTTPRQRRNVARWLIKDRNAFRDLVQDLRELIDDLESLTNFPDVAQKQRIITSFEVESIADDDSMSILQESITGDEDQLSEVASVRALQSPTMVQNEADVHSTNDSTLQATVPVFAKLDISSNSSNRQVQSDSILAEQDSCELSAGLGSSSKPIIHDEATKEVTRELDTGALSPQIKPTKPLLSRQYAQRTVLSEFNESSNITAYLVSTNYSAVNTTLPLKQGSQQIGNFSSDDSSGRPNVNHAEPDLDSAVDLKRCAHSLRAEVDKVHGILPRADRTAIKNLENDISGVRETLAHVEMAWQLARNSGKFRNVRYAWKGCCGFLRYYNTMLELVPERDEYFALFTSVLKHIILATSTDEESARVASRALEAIGRGMELCCNADTPNATRLTLEQVENLYICIFSYLTGILYNIRSRTLQGPLDDKLNNLFRDQSQEDLKRDVLKSLEAIESHLRAKIVSEQRLLLSSVESTRADAQRVLAGMRHALPRSYRDPAELERLMVQHQVHGHRNS